MDKGKKIDLVVLVILLASISAIVMILASLRAKNRLERVAALSVLYNAGLGADYKSLLTSPSYFYDDRVLDAYTYFADIDDSSEIELSNSIKMHNVPESSLFDYNQTI